MDFEKEPSVGSEETFWVFSTSLRWDALQSHKETSGDHLSYEFHPHPAIKAAGVSLKRALVSVLSPCCFLNPPLCWLEVREDDGSHASLPACLQDSDTKPIMLPLWSFNFPLSFSLLTLQLPPSANRRLARTTGSRALLNIYAFFYRWKVIKWD